MLISLITYMSIFYQGNAYQFNSKFQSDNYVKDKCQGSFLRIIYVKCFVCLT